MRLGLNTGYSGGKIALPMELIREADRYAVHLGQTDQSDLYGVTDGKAIGTHVEHGFRAWLARNYSYEEGNAASGLDFPGLSVDMKVTSSRHPQSSCPFRNARQKIYGLGYSLLIFVYDKTDNDEIQAARLRITNAVFVDAEWTADHQTTRGLRDILDNDGNADDLVAFLQDRNLPVDEIGARDLAEEILERPPRIGYLTISNALQWRLQFARVLQEAGNIQGIERIR